MIAQSWGSLHIFVRLKNMGTHWPMKFFTIKFVLIGCFNILERILCIADSVMHYHAKAFTKNVLCIADSVMHYQHKSLHQHFLRIADSVMHYHTKAFTKIFCALQILSCTTTKNSSPKMARRLSNDSTAAKLTSGMMSASRR